MDHQQRLEFTAMTGEANRRVAIEKWMLSIVKDGGVERYDDVHIDRIDPQWKTADSWVDGGLEAFRVAVSVRDRYALSLSVILAFRLEEKDGGRGAATSGFSLSRITPPSIYLFPEGEEPWSREYDASYVVTAVDPRPIIGDLFHGAAYLARYLVAGSDECSYTLLVGG